MVPCSVVDEASEAGAPSESRRSSAARSSVAQSELTSGYADSTVSRDRRSSGTRRSSAGTRRRSEDADRRESYASSAASSYLSGAYTDASYGTADGEHDHDDDDDARSYSTGSYLTGSYVSRASDASASFVSRRSAGGVSEALDEDEHRSEASSDETETASVVVRGARVSTSSAAQSTAVDDAREPDAHPGAQEVAAVHILPPSNGDGAHDDDDGEETQVDETAPARQLTPVSAEALEKHALAYGRRATGPVDVDSGLGSDAPSSAALAALTDAEAAGYFRRVAEEAASSVGG